MIICTTSEQLSEWIKVEHFQIDLSFKRVASEINEFEVNYYNTQHNLRKLICFILFIQLVLILQNLYNSILYYIHH